MNFKLVSIIVVALALTVGYRSKQAWQPAQVDPVNPTQISGRLSYVASQSGCSTSDQKLMSAYSSAAVEALVAGNLERYSKLEQELDQKLSSSCLRVLAQLYPVRVNCSVDEKRITLAHYEGVIQATLAVDFIRAFNLLDDLEGSLSEECWLAVNYPQDTGVRQACSASELTIIASAAGPARRALKGLFMTGDFSATIQLLQELSEKLSLECQTALSRVPKPPPQPGRVNRSQFMPELVQDHGGGTYSMPGVGACTPSGCMAF